MQASLSFGLSVWRLVLAALALAFLVLAVPATAQQVQENRIEADLVAENAPVPGETLWLALRFRPEEGWHGYWSNPGEAGLGMELQWQDLPPSWEIGAPQYPVPHVLTLFNIANHAYKEDYAVLIPVRIDESDAVMNYAPPTVEAQWLACSDELCIPERATLTVRFPQEGDALRAQFDDHRAAIPPMLDRQGSFALTGNTLRVAVPLPESVELTQPHFFIEQRRLSADKRPDYGGVQRFFRNGDMVIVEMPMSDFLLPEGSDLAAFPPLDQITGILAFDDAGNGVQLTAAPGEVPSGGTPLGGAMADSPLALLLGGALLGGLLLNLMPCVFPILSLKALTLARAGESEAEAKREGLAYTAGVMLAVLALGALMLALRAAGEQVGWAFQLQQPLVVAALLVLATLITANLAGLFEIPSLPIRSRGGGSAFATGLLAAVAATPCTGPFMAAALGAALLLPVPQALLLFAALGFGLALPFLLLGYVPALRSRLPQPGRWMETFRKVMAIPMGLTALALIWLAWRLGGAHFAFSALALGVLIVVTLVAASRGHRGIVAIGAVACVYFAASLPFRVEDQSQLTAESVLEPVTYSEEALAEARASGQPVFLWFTADWCVSCKVNEGVAIEREATRAAFEEAGVIAMRGDWTRADPEITRYLEQWGVAGVPLYVWFPAGGEGEQLPQVLTPNVLVDRAEAE